MTTRSLIELPTGRVSRRRFVWGTSALAASAAVWRPRAGRAADVLKIGYVSPKTGPLAPFAEADDFVLGGLKETFAGGLDVGGTKYGVEILVKDSQSNPNRAAEVAGELILSDEVDLMTVASTPETTNPVADQCELNEIPCISTMAPWQPWFFTRGGDPAKGFDWTWHFFWGLEDIIGVFLGMWDQVPTNKVVGGLFPNDGDGNAWGDPKLGFPPVLAEKGFSLVDPGRYQNLSTDFTAQINAFKQGNAEIITGVVLPPDFTTFWTQAKQQGLAPKVVSVGKALLFPVAVEALGDTGNNISTEIWWSPSHPFKSSLTGVTAKDFAAAYTTATSKQWTQPIGFIHGLFEVAADVLKRSGDPKDKAAVAAAIAPTSLDTIVGKVAWGAGPVKNVAKTPLVGGQWRRTPDGPFKYDLVITANGTAPEIPLGGKMEPIA
ncbi:MAG: ABC transporter substrate-binding protein [Geminicoccaceae bacterium]